MVLNWLHAQHPLNLHHTNPFWIFWRDVLEMSGLFSSAFCLPPFPESGPHVSPSNCSLPHTYPSLCLRSLLDLPNGESSSPGGEGRPLFPYFPQPLPETDFLGCSGVSLKDSRPPHTIFMGPTLIPNPLPFQPKQLSFLWQEGKVLGCALYIP